MTAPPRKPLFSSNHHFDVLICLGLVLAIFIPYAQVAGHRFIEFDDGLYAFQNNYIIRGLCWDSVRWAFTNSESANWQPLTWISHLIDRELFGPHPGGYLLESVAWHALAACLLYWALLRTTGSRLFGLLVALLFALHPANVENVAWLSERKSLLNAVFWFGALLAWIDFIEKPSFRAWGITTIAFLLSLWSKPMSITLPATLVLIHLLYLAYHPERREPGARLGVSARTLLLPVLPLVAVAVYFTAITLFTQAVAMPTNYPADLRLINAVRSTGRYLAMFFHPTALANFYPLFQQELTLRVAVVPLLALAAISAGSILLVRRAPQLLIGWAWYLGTLVPVIGLVQVGSQSHADRYLYIPMVGLAFVFPVLLDGLRSLGVLGRRIVTGGMFAGLALSLGVATTIQVSYWKDGVELFRHSLAVTGDCLTTVMNLAVAYSRTGRFPQLIAFTDAKIAVATVPENKAKLARIRASGLAALKKYEEAIKSAQQALDWGDTDETNYWILAICNYELGRPEQAARFLPKTRGVKMTVNRWNLFDSIRVTNWLVLEEALKHPETAKIQPTATPTPASASTLAPAPASVPVSAPTPAPAATHAAQSTSSASRP